MQEYSRLVGIDVGKKRIGIAQTDLLKTISSPVGTYSPELVFDALRLIVSQSKVDKFIVGWPLMPNGQEGDSITMVKEFINKLTFEFPEISIEKIDERNTSNKAIQLMVEAGISKKKRREKERVDRIAAAVILQHYLDEYY
ncbi:MAG: Holliday junction resolvase RuvX [Balneolaceae bacterium]